MCVCVCVCVCGVQHCGGGLVVVVSAVVCTYGSHVFSVVLQSEPLFPVVVVCGGDFM